jgi:cell wall assembly regulator SMI1
MDDDHDPETIALIERLRGYWMQKGIKIRPGVSLQQIESFESRNLVRLPPDLRRYFATVDGMEEGETDTDMFSFLSLEAVKSIPEELAHFGSIPDYGEIMRSLPDPNRWFVIVAYLTSSAVYAIRLCADPEGTPVLWIGDGTHNRVVASSFSGFLEAYLADPLLL